MATTTPRIGLTKPDGTDLVDVAVLNTNFDKIDSNIASTKIQATKPTTANAGDLWWDSDTGTLYLYYVDANSSQWVAATSDPINIGVVANQTERDAQYPTPAQGMSVYRTDLGVTQRYYGLFNASTNPGGRDSAGWYDTEKSIGLVPIIPTISYSGGTATVGSMGEVTFSGTSYISFNNVFTSSYSNYRIVIAEAVPAAETDLHFRLRNGTTDETNTSYYTGAARMGTATNVVNSLGQSATTYGFLGQSGNVFQGSVEVHNPMNSNWTSYQSHITGQVSGYSISAYVGAGAFASAATYNGFTIKPAGATTISGAITLYRYND